MNELDFGIAIVITMAITMLFLSTQNAMAQEKAQEITEFKETIKLLQKSNELMESCQGTECTGNKINSHKLNVRSQEQNENKGKCITRLGIYNNKPTTAKTCIETQ